MTAEIKINKIKILNDDTAEEIIPERKRKEKE